MITAEIIQAAVFSQRGLTNAPIMVRSLVNRTSGTTANGSCRLRIDLAEHQQLGGAAFAVERGDDHRRDDRDQPRDEPPQPGAAGGC